jgi:hypothetical protein
LGEGRRKASPGQDKKELASLGRANRYRSVARVREDDGRVRGDEELGTILFHHLFEQDEEGQLPKG